MDKNKQSDISFIVNEKGEKTHAVVSIELYQELLNLKKYFSEDFNIEEKENYFFSVKGVSASGFPLGKKNRPSFMINEGSMVSLKYATSLRLPVKELRQSLIDNGTLTWDEEHNCYVFAESYLCSSASFAASLVAGNNRNGLEVWETKDGYTLRDLGYGINDDDNSLLEE